MLLSGHIMELAYVEPAFEIVEASNGSLTVTVAGDETPGQEDFDLTFGLLHTVEKSAEILVKILSMTPNKLQTITPDNFRSLAKDFKVSLPEEFLYEKQ